MRTQATRSDTASHSSSLCAIPFCPGKDGPNATRLGTARAYVAPVVVTGVASSPVTAA